MRQHLNIHQSFNESCQRLFNAIGLDSYIRPHRHLVDRKVETLVAVRGAFALVEFDGEGKPTNVTRFGTEAASQNMAVGVELSPDVWHTVVALTPLAVLFEVKEGPFRPDAAKDYAPWAPEEGGGRASSYLASLHRIITEW